MTPAEAEIDRRYGPFTDEVWAAIRAKPEYAQPCNGCGLCCLMEQCALSVELFNPQPRCPALERAGDRYACGLVTAPARHLGVPLDTAPELAARFGEMLAVGYGCDGQADWEAA